jgi:hypothetical protein
MFVNNKQINKISKEGPTTNGNGSYSIAIYYGQRR